MAKIEVFTGTGYGDANLAIAILKGTRAKCTVAQFTPPTDFMNIHNSSAWPLVLKCSSEDKGLDEFEVRILFLTSGDGVELEENLRRVLEAAGFENERIDFSKPKAFIKE